METGAILLRVSSERQAADDKASYKVQQKDCQQWADTHDAVVPQDLIWQEVATRDQYYTRDGLQAALTAARERLYQVLIVWRLDRLTDNPGRFMQIVEELASYGVRVVYATEPDTNTDTPLGKWLAYTRTLFQVQPERTTTAKRTQDARRLYTAQGRPWAGHSPRYGYQWVVDWSRTKKHGGVEIPLKERLEPDPVTAPVVQQLYAWVSEGRSLKWIARALTGLEDGGIYKTPTPRQHSGIAGANGNSEWDDTSICRMLQFPGYMGRWPAYRTQRKKRTDGSERIQQVSIKEDDWVWVEPSPAPALVDAALWHQVQRRLTANKQFSRRNRSNPVTLEDALLSRGMARCSLCGGPLDARPYKHGFDRPDGSRTYLYQCRAARRNFPACAGMQWNAETIDRSVWAALLTVLRSPETIARLARRSQERERAEADGIAVITPVDTATALQKKLADKERELQNLTLRSAGLAADNPAVVGYDLAIQALGAEVTTLRDEYAHAERQAAKYQRVEQIIVSWEDYLRVWNDNTKWFGSQSYPAAEKRQWLEALGARVIVYPHTRGKSRDANAPIATLKLHLTRLDLATGTATAIASKRDEEPVGVPVPFTPPRRPPMSAKFAAFVAASSANQEERWAQLPAALTSRTDEERMGPEAFAKCFGWTVEEARQYQAECDALFAQTPPVDWIPTAQEWIQDYRNRPATQQGDGTDTGIQATSGPVDLCSSPQTRLPKVVRLPARSRH